MFDTQALPLFVPVENGMSDAVIVARSESHVFGYHVGELNAWNINTGKNEKFFGVDILPVYDIAMEWTKLPTYVQDAITFGMEGKKISAIKFLRAFNAEHGGPRGLSDCKKIVEYGYGERRY